jgi:inner membrane protein involved in colicin E2 resistance
MSVHCESARAGDVPSTAREPEGERVVVTVSPELVVLLLSRTDRTKRYATLFVLLYFLYYFVFRNALQAREMAFPTLLMV